MMTSATRATLAAVVLLSICACICAAPAIQPHPIAERDTDDASELRSKLGRIRDLLSQLETTDAEYDLKKVADVPTNRREPKQSGDAQEKDMRSLEKHPAYKVPPPPKNEAKPDRGDSIQLLAQALASLRQPVKGVEGSDGDRMSSRYNDDKEEDAVEEEVTRKLEQSIERALARLQMEDGGESDPEAEVAEPLQPARLHAAAVRIIESRLLHVLNEAEQLGLSMEELIQDLEERALREETLQKLEDSLASFTGDRNE